MIRMPPHTRRWLVASLLVLLTLQLGGCPPAESTGSPRSPLPTPGGGGAGGGGLVVVPPRSGAAQAPGPQLPVMGPPVAQVAQEPEVRIRLLIGTKNIEVSPGTGGGNLLIAPFGAPASEARAFTPPVAISRGQDGFVLRPRAGQAFAWRVTGLVVKAQNVDSITLNNKNTYPHFISLHGVGTAAPEFDVVNHTLLEEYLPGVLDKELYKNWAAQTYLAQSIAARSYAIFSINRSARRYFDLESSVVSQAYNGTVNNPVATSAVRQTRGLVLAWKGEVLPAYYSAANGGLGQDAVVAFADGADVPPLRGRRFEYNWEAACPNYRWGPIVRSRAELSRRFADWGRENRHPIAGISEIESIAITAKNSAGRPTQFTIGDNTGKRFTLMAEEFRFACNNNAPGAAELKPTQTLKSSHVTVTVSKGNVTFSDGRGFGHGVGMSQWGAQGMALRGVEFRKILDAYYPGAEVVRAYK